jgi:hypothetical protein
MGNSMAATNATDVNRIDGGPISLKGLSVVTVRQHQVSALATRGNIRRTLAD